MSSHNIKEVGNWPKVIAQGMRADLTHRARNNKPTFFDAELEDMPHVVSFSGGRTSGLMLRQLLDTGLKPLVLFENTGKERDETLEFVHAVETHWAVPVVWLEYTRVPAASVPLSVFPTPRRRQHVERQAAAGETTHWFKVVNYETAARRIDPTPFNELLGWMSVLPNTRARACTKELKIMTGIRYLWSLGITSFVNHIGIRADEADRAFDMIGAKDRLWDICLSFPLLDEVKEQHVREYWWSSPFDLQLKPYEGNCDMCFLKTRAKKIQLIRENPGMADWWKGWERAKRKQIGEGNGAKFRAENGHSYAALEAYAASPEACEAEGIQFIEEEGAMECACTSGAMDYTDSDSEAESP